MLFQFHFTVSDSPFPPSDCQVQPSTHPVKPASFADTDFFHSSPYNLNIAFILPE